jgi:hypothetical protein
VNRGTGKDRDEATIESRAPHAWFVAYTYLQPRDRAEAAVAQMADNSGEGSEIATPILPRLLEIYFHGSALTRYPWRASLGGGAVTSAPQAACDFREVDLRDPFRTCPGNHPSPDVPQYPWKAFAAAMPRERGARR